MLEVKFVMAIKSDTFFGIHPKMLTALSSEQIEFITNASRY